MKKILPLWLVIFISFFCYASMLTMFVPLLQANTSPLYNPTLSSAHTNILCGILLALYPLGQFLGSPVIGALSDRWGRKKLLSLSLMLTTVCLLMMAYAISIKSLVLLASACFIAGLGEANMALALSAIADLTTIETRSSAFARAWVMCSVGYILGSLFGGVAAWLGYAATFLIEAAFVLLTWATTALFFTDKVQVMSHNALKNILLTFSGIFQKATIRPYYLANFVAYLACFGVLRVELIYMQGYFQLSQIQIAMIYAYASVIAMLANFIVTPLLLKNSSVKSVILMAGTAAFISSVIFIIPTHKNALWLTAGLIALFIPITVAMLGALISGQGLIEQQGAIMGNNQSLQVLAEAISAMLGGYIFSVNQQAPFIIFALLGFGSLMLYRRLR